jgi:hypothetical protein
MLMLLPICIEYGTSLDFMFLSVSHVQGNGHDNICIGIERLFDIELIEIILSGFIIFVGISYCFGLILMKCLMHHRFILGPFIDVIFVDIFTYKSS